MLWSFVFRGGVDAASHFSEMRSESCKNCGFSYDVRVKVQQGIVEVSVDNHPEITPVATFFNMDLDLSMFAPSAEPYSVFLRARRDLDALGQQLEVAGIHPTTSGLPFVDLAAVVDRMTLVQHFAIVEAYLSDTILGLVERHDTVAAAVIKVLPDLGKEKIALEHLLDDPSLPKQKLVTHLRRMSYHNFGQIEVIFKAALDLDIAPDKFVRDRLFKIMQARHDCVHRNGVSQDGTTHQDIGKLAEAADGIFETMVRRIEDAVQRKDVALDADAQA